MDPKEIIDLHSAIRESLVQEVSNLVQQNFAQFAQALNELFSRVNELSDQVTTITGQTVEPECADPDNCCMEDPCAKANNEWARANRLTGAFFKRNRWQAQKGFLGKDIYLGTFDTAEEAHAAFVGATQAINFLNERT